MHNFLKIKYLNKKIKMGNCQKILDSQKEIIFESQLPKRTFNYQKLNKTIIFEYSYIKYHHPIPISINQPIEKPPKYYKNEKPPDIINEKFIDTYFPPSEHSLEYISDYNKTFVDLNEIKEFKKDCISVNDTQLLALPYCDAIIISKRRLHRKEVQTTLV